MTYYIDLNCDLGEGISPQDCLKDAQIMPYLSSCNIACGGHAGTLETIQLSLENATKNNLSIGAHPGYPDKKNFGRHSLDISAQDLIESIDEQLIRFLNVVKEMKLQCRHIKLHGALYNDLEIKSSYRDAVVEYLLKAHSGLQIFGLAGGKFEEVCTDAGLNFIAEGFIDRTYRPNGRLTPRSEANALIVEPDKSAQQALRIATGQPITATDNSKVMINAKTLCIHGDGENAFEFVGAVTQLFKTKNVTVAAIS